MDSYTVNASKGKIFCLLCIHQVNPLLRLQWLVEGKLIYMLRASLEFFFIKLFLFLLAFMLCHLVRCTSHVGLLTPSP